MIWNPFGKKPAKPGTKDFAKSLLRDLKAQANEAYKLARRDRPRESYQPQGHSGDSAIIGSHDLMNRRTRDLSRNVADAKRIRQFLVDAVVGKGMQTFAWPFLPSELFQLITEIKTIRTGQLGPRLQFALEADDLFNEYCNDKKQFDIEGRLTATEMYRMMMGEAVTVGNGLMVRVFRKDYDPDKHLVPVCWQMFEREQLDQSQDRPASKGFNKIVGGLEVDSNNRVVAYHLYLDHPHDFFGINQSGLMGAGAGVSSGESLRIDADRVIDLARYDRPSSALGATWLDAAGQAIWDKDSYCESEIRTAAVDAVFAYVAKLKNAEKYGAWGFADGEDEEDEFGNREFRIGHSPIASVIGTEESLEMVRPARPNRDAGPFLQILNRQIAASTGISYYSLTGDYAATNFSSTRAAKLDEDLFIGPTQQWFGQVVALPVRRTFNAIAGASGRYQSLRPAQFRREFRTFQRFDVIANGRDLLDPFKEGEARTTRLRTRLASYKDECAKQNKHWIRELMQHSIEQQVFDLFGLTPDFTKYGSVPQEQGNSTDSAAAAEEAANLLYLFSEDQ